MEIIEIEREAAVLSQRDDLARRVPARRRAVGRQAHDLVFVTVIGKAEILGQGLVEDAERVREMHPALDADLRPATDPPGGAGKVAQTIDRNDNRLVEGRDVECRGQMREMMLDRVEPAAKPL